MTIFPALFLLNLLLSFSTDIELDAARYFDTYGVKGCFMLFDKGNDKIYTYNPAQCKEGFIPKSTFKIPHALIALEEGVLKDDEQIIKWDSTQYPFESWNQDQNLESAIKNSCVWFFSSLTEKIESSTYQKYLTMFNYGNRQVSGPAQRFWLFGDLRISAAQQIDFLERFYFDKLPVKYENKECIKKLIFIEGNQEYRMYGKTGGGPVSRDETIMWLVGFIEKNENVYFYALNFFCEEYNNTTASARFDITKNILHDLTIIP